MPVPGNISGLTPDVLAGVLSKVSGSTVHPEMIALDIRDGAPVNPDGTIPLVAYIAWLVKQGTDGSRA